MKRVIVVLLLVLVSALPFGAASAYPFCGPYQPPNQPSQFCRYDLVANDTYRLASGVPFAWLRAEPSSSAGIRGTVQPGTSASMVTVGGSAHWDGVQWWYEMTTYPDRRVRGWVERVSLAQVVRQPAPAPQTPQPAPGNDPSIEEKAAWNAPFDARVEAGVPFLWLREGPNQGRAVLTISANGAFRVTGPAAFDGHQWWWQVAAQGSSGWVEQGSITPV